MTFDVEIDFESQIKALFDTSPLPQFSELNNFLWVCWFLGKNLSNFVPTARKLDNPYYHNTCEKMESDELWFFSLKTSLESLDCLIAFSTHPTIPNLFSVSAPSLVVAFLIARLNEFFLFSSYWNSGLIWIQLIFG